MNFVFDFGNVLIEWNKDTILKSVASSSKIEIALDGAIFGSGIWESIDAGYITIDKAQQMVEERLDGYHRQEVNEILWHWYRHVEVYQEVVDKIIELKRNGHQIYILSNTSQLFHVILDERYPHLKENLDGFILSCDVKQMKPGKDIYMSLIREYNLNVAKTYFFDDLYDNVLSARRLGMWAFQVKNIPDLLKELNKFL